MRLKDSSLYLCLSILLCRIPPLALVAARGAASPHMEIILPPVDTHHLGDIPQFSSNKASPHDSASKPLALSSQGSAAAALFLHSSNSKEIEASRPATTTNSKLKKRFLDNTGPLIQAPTPEYRITSLALLTTVDGNLHCIDTRNGELFWTRPPQAVGAIVSSNVTKYTKSRSRGSDTDIFASSSIEGEQDGTRPAGLLDGDIEYDSEDWTFIVEPAEIPRLYVYSNSSGLQPVGSLVHLVTNSPQIRPDGKRITGGKKTSLLELDISTGQVVNTFEAPNGCTGPEGIKASGLTIVLGHAEYTLCIADPISGMQWDISYSEYFPVTENPSVVKDGPMTWIGIDKDGLVAFWKSDAGIMWRKKLASPTTAVFEIYVNFNTQKAVLARQKRLPGMDELSPIAHVRMYQDQLYVLSEQNYPLLGKPDPEKVRLPYMGIEGSGEDQPSCRAGSPNFPGCIVGPHMVGFPFRPDGFLTVDDGLDMDKDEEIVTMPEGNDSFRSRSNTHDPFADPPPISRATTVVGWLVISVGILTAIVHTKGISNLVQPIDNFLEQNNMQFRVYGLVKAVIQGAAVASTAALTVASAIGISNRDNRDSLPAFNDKSMVSSIQLELEQRRDEATIREKSAGQVSEKPEKGGRKGPRNKPSNQETAEGKINGANGANGTGVGTGGNGSGGRKKKRGTGGKSQKAAAAAAAGTAAAPAETGDGNNNSKSTLEHKDEVSSEPAGFLAAGRSSENDGRKSASSQETVVDSTSSLTPIRPPSNAPALKSIQVTDIVLGYGSHGTVVYKGTYDGRAVAVKRLLIDFYDVAFHEVRLLQESDDHANVVRYFRSEQCDRFLYIALELCSASLDDIIERGHMQPYRDLSATLEPQKILFQIISGIHHLHSLKIVHRDIKPQNILVGEPKRKPKPSKSSLLSTSSLSATPPPPPLGSSGMITSVVRANSVPSPAQDLYPGRVLISDFGLCRKLENDQSSFHNTTVHGGRGGAGGGTIGWRAPECFLGMDQDDELLQAMVNGTVSGTLADDSSSSSQEVGGSGSSGGRANRMTRAIDIFSTGCVFYYVLTNGEHPFGDRYSRERNILLNRPNLSGLDALGQEGVEAKDLISRMIAHDPADRPDAFTVMHHPYFWSANKRLMFMQDCSDRFEIEDRGVDADLPSQLLIKLEQNAKEILVKDWYKVIDRTLVENLGKYRKYDGNSVRDLLRALRNKKHHYQDLPPHVKRALGDLPHGFLNYFTSRFPKLMLHLYYVVANDPELRNESMFRHYFVD